MPSSKKPAHVAECHGVKVPDSPMLTPMRIERINAARYEGQEIAGALKVVRPGDKVLELGAGIGIVGAVVAKNAKPAKVMSFEANPSLMEHITALQKMNRLSSKMELRNEVLISAPDAPKTMAFHIRSSYLGSSLIDSDSRATTKVDIPTASYAKVHKDFAPDVLLMDIEGGELDFLRHADLSGIRAIVVEFHPDAYGKAGMRECKAILQKAGFAQVPGHCTRLVWTCVHEPALSAPMPNAGWSSAIETLEQPVVVPAAENGFTQPSGVLRANGTYCAAGASWRNGRVLTSLPDGPQGPMATRKGTWLWGGVLWRHFGHFVVESTARLWALAHLNEDIDGVLFIPKRPRNGGDVLPYHRDFLAAMGFEGDVVCTETPEKVERLIVPGQGIGLGNMIGGTDLYRDAMRSLVGRDIAAEGPEKLYISRSKLPSGRGNLIGELELEAHLEAEGYTIYHPQDHDITHQIATYKAARQVVAAEGSALHMLAMVADPKAEVAMVVRRPSGATQNIEAHLHSCTGKAPLTIMQLKRSWKPRGKAKPRSWMGELDMPALQKALAKGKFVSAKRKAWGPLEASVVQDRLGGKFEEVA